MHTFSPTNRTSHATQMYYTDDNPDILSFPMIFFAQSLYRSTSAQTIKELALLLESSESSPALCHAKENLSQCSLSQLGVTAQSSSVHSPLIISYSSIVKV